MIPQQVFTVLKSCCRCGAEFRALGQQRVCSGCRKPTKTERVWRSTRDLSLREKQVVELVRLGKGNKEIADNLHLTSGTVKQYLNRIFWKAQVSNRTELAVWSMTHQANP